MLRKRSARRPPLLIGRTVKEALVRKRIGFASGVESTMLAAVTV
jgi:hypothetical protein